MGGWKGYCYQQQHHCRCDGHFHVVAFVDDSQKVAVAGVVVAAVEAAGVVQGGAVDAGIGVVAADGGGRRLAFEAAFGIVGVDEHDSGHERLLQEVHEVHAVASSCEC